jgi:hypothetical protein
MRFPQPHDPDLGVQGVGGGQQLLDPGAGLAHMVPLRPEEPQDAEQVGQRRGVVAECPVSLDLVRQQPADLRRARSAETPSSWLSH